MNCLIIKSSSNNSAEKNKNRKYLITHTRFLEPCHAVCVLGAKGGGGAGITALWELIRLYDSVWVATTDLASTALEFGYSIVSLKM